MKAMRDNEMKFKNKIAGLIDSYKLDVGAIHEIPHESSQNFSLSIECGNNEGYFVNITSDMRTWFLRIHSKDEAVKTLGVMLQLLPNN